MTVPVETLFTKTLFFGNIKHDIISGTSSYNPLERVVDEMRHLVNHLIVGGDFNLILDPKIDAERDDASTYDSIAEELLECLARCNLTDAYRFLYPGRKTYTYSPNGDRKSTRLNSSHT